MSAASARPRQGAVPLAAPPGGGLHLPAGDQVPGAPARRARRADARATTASSATPSARATPGWRSTAGTSRTKVVRGFGTHEFDREGRYLEAQVGRPVGGLAVPAVRLRRPPSAGLQVPLPGGLRRAPGAPAGAGGATTSSAATGTSPTAPIDLRNWKRQPEELRLPARGARLDGPAVRSRAATWMPSARCARSRTCTPGGPIAARRARTTSAGALTTRSSAARSPARRARRAIYKEQALLRPRAADHGLRALSAVLAQARPKLAPGAGEPEDARDPGHGCRLRLSQPDHRDRAAGLAEGQRRHQHHDRHPLVRGVALPAQAPVGAAR